MSVDSENEFELDSWQVFSLRVMVKHARNLGLTKGVAFVSVQKWNKEMGGVRFMAVGKNFQREPNPSIEGDKGTNYFGIAMSKLAVMMATELNSGTFKERFKKGEVPYRGGLVRKVREYKIYTGFSGGTEDEDVEIAELGMTSLLF